MSERRKTGESSAYSSKKYSAEIESVRQNGIGGRRTKEESVDLRNGAVDVIRGSKKKPNSNERRVERSQ
jgi:hypothetical protein